MKTERRRLGDIGENVACVFLKKHGFKVIERNYLRKWGELDIVARKGEMLHFIEVKSVTHGTSIRAEENLHPGKLKRLHRVMQTYILEKGLDLDFQLDLVVVVIDETARTARAQILENII